MKKYVKLYEEWNENNLVFSLLESIDGDTKTIQKEVEDIKNEIGDDKITDTDVAATLLLKTIEADGDIEKVDPEEVKAAVKEGIVTYKDYKINESAEGVLHIIEQLGSIIGNSALLNYIFDMIDEKTGKKVDRAKVTKFLGGIIGVLKKITGIPAKAIEKFFEFIGKKLDVGKSGEKAMGLIGLALVTTVFLTLGVAHFPVLGGGVLMWILSLTGIIGKSMELVKLIKAIFEVISKKEKITDEVDKALNALSTV